MMRKRNAIVVLVAIFCLLLPTLALAAPAAKAITRTGRVSAVNTANRTFTLKRGKNAFKVKVTSGTIIRLHGKKVVFGDITSGSRVRVRGVKSGRTISAVGIVILIEKK